MALLNWKNEYVVGNSQIDDDHKHLFDLINEFHYAFIQNHERKDIARVLNNLVKYSEEHFQREENVMAEIGYPGLAAHQAIHADLFETLFALQSKFEDGSVKMEKETIEFLRHWLTDHIAEHDMNVSEFLHK